jgi:signal transduction histidine kinase
VFNRNVARTTTFRLTAALGGAFALGVLLLLGSVYLETTQYLSNRVDSILRVEMQQLSASTPDKVLRIVREKAVHDPILGLGLFDPTGGYIAGETILTPADMPVDGLPRNFAARRGAPPHRALASRLPWGQILVVQRDASQFLEIRHIIIGAVVWSGVVILIMGALLAFVLSLPSLRRVQAMQAASDAIGAGDLGVRLPVNGSGDELDELAQMVNRMVDEVERLMTQARTVGESVAHELRTPLTRLRATLDHAAQSVDPEDETAALLEKCVVETDGVMARFQALLRIAALEARSRESGIGAASLSDIMEQLAELYEPLAAEREIVLSKAIAPGVAVRADGELMFEAVSNLIDNALKFTPAGGDVFLGLSMTGDGAQVEVRDNGQGIAAAELPLVTRRLFRSQAAVKVPGFGLGLSLVAAVAALHRFPLFIEDAGPGVRVRIVCARPAPATPLRPSRP